MLNKTVIISLFLIITLMGCTTFDRKIPPETDPKLHYEIYGKGKPILFLHGFGGNVYSWKKIVGPLSEYYQVILLDLQGFGKSPKPMDGDYSIRAQATLVKRFIQEHRLRDVTLAGNSLGGGVALLTMLDLSQEAPDLISSLILIDSIAYRQKLPFFIRFLKSDVGRFLLFALPKNLQVWTILSYAYFDDEKITEEAINAYARPLRSTEGRHALVETARHLIPSNIDDTTEKFKNVRIPVLILWGEKDKVVPQHVRDRLSEDFQHSRCTIFPATGHLPQEERPKETGEQILKFMREGLLSFHESCQTMKF